LLVLWIAKQIFGDLIIQQIKGSIPDYTTERVRMAVKHLPAELREEREADWLAELATLKDKPLSALRFAWGLGRAARRIAFCHATGRQWTRRAGAMTKWREQSTRLVRLSGVDACDIDRDHVELAHAACTGCAAVLAALMTLKIELLSLSLFSTALGRTTLGCLLFVIAFVVAYGGLVLGMFLPVIWQLTRENQAESP
jgi:hypothetical protein